MDVRDFIINSYKIPKKNSYLKGRKCGEIALSKGFSKKQIINALNSINNLSRGFKNGVSNFLRDR